MTERRQNLPPLNALKAFHATMRRKSLQAAAAELSVTPQAVSQQIKLLETFIQVTLFVKDGRSIQPTGDAVLLASYVENGFAEIAEGLRRVGRGQASDRINLNVTPYFATQYLIPRLDGFRRIRPTCDLRLTTKIEIPDFARDEIDAAIQWGYDGRWANFHTSMLARDHKIICCAPSLMKAKPALNEPQDLCFHTLLNVGVPNTLWADILTFLDVKTPGKGSAVALDDAASMRRATLAGMGVGLISRPDAEQDIKSGALIAPLGMDVLANFPEDRVPGFFLVLPKPRRRDGVVASFCKWVEEEDWTSEMDDLYGETAKGPSIS